MKPSAPWVVEAARPPRPTSRARRATAAILIVVPVLLALSVPLYQRIEPSLFGLPFFYWFQMSMAVAAATGTGIAYRMLFAGRGPR